MCRLGVVPRGYCDAAMDVAARSAIMIVGTLVSPETIIGIAPASATLRLSGPCHADGDQ
jgi:hypothetical protein